MRGPTTTSRSRSTSRCSCRSFASGCLNKDALSAMSSNEDIEIRLLLEAIYLRFHYDFRSYSMASIRRRLAQAKGHLGCDTIAGLEDAVLGDPRVFPALLQFLTVQVSDMFRDPSFYGALRREV